MNRSTSFFFSPALLAFGLLLGCRDTSVEAPAPVGGAGTVSTLAGSTSGFADGSGTAAQFNIMYGLVSDAAGTLYIADSDNNRIRKVTASGTVTTLAGSDSGFADGTGASAKFKVPYGITLDAAGNIYTSDLLNQCIRKITPAGEVSKFAGTAQVSGYSDGQKDTAKFNLPRGLAFDVSGNLFVVEGGNYIRKISPAGIVSTLAGNGTTGFADGAGSAARFSFPYGAATDAAGNVYVSDQNNHAIRKITPAGIVSTLAGNGTAGFADGSGTAARFNTPRSLTIDPSGNLYVADKGNNAIRKISPAGSVTTLAGSAAAGTADGSASTARFNAPYSVGIDNAGNLYIADQGNFRIRKFAP